MSSKGGVGILETTRHLVFLDGLLNFTDKIDNRVVFLISLSKGGLELAVGIQQALNFFHCVDNKHINEVLSGAIEPVVEGLQEHNFRNASFELIQWVTTNNQGLTAALLANSR